MYGSSANLVISTGNGVNGYTLDNVRTRHYAPACTCLTPQLQQGIGEFILTHPNIRIPSRGKIYSFNEGNALFFHECVSHFLSYKSPSSR